MCCQCSPADLLWDYPPHPLFGSVFTGNHTHRKQGRPGGPERCHIRGGQAVCWGERWASVLERPEKAFCDGVVGFRDFWEQVMRIMWSLMMCVSFHRFVVSWSQCKNVSLSPNVEYETLGCTRPHNCPYVSRGENVEDAFLEAAKKIYQNIQDGSLDLNAAESGVQHKPSAPQGGRLTSEPQPQREGCGC